MGRFISFNANHLSKKKCEYVCLVLNEIFSVEDLNLGVFFILH